MKKRVVASYTTLPKRYDVLVKSIKSLKQQTVPLDAIYLTIPKKAARLNQEYPSIPDELKSLCTLIHIETDFGPLTKIYGALISEKDPETVIISCDDDVEFKKDHVEILLRHHDDHPKAAICGTGALLGKGLLFISIVSSVEPFHNYKAMTGFHVPKKGRKVDLIFGVAGVLYTRAMFPNNDMLHEELLKYSLLDDSIFCNDDVLISGYFSKMKIERRVFTDIPSIIHLSGDDALSGEIFKMISRLNVAIDKVKQHGLFLEMEEVSFNETPAGRIFIALIFIIIIIILVIYMFS